jgi:hypothetical protein
MEPHRRSVLVAGFGAGLAFGLARPSSGSAMTSPALIDDLSQPHPRAANGAAWAFFSDQVMGGVSTGGMARESVAGRMALRLRGAVSLDNNGGFVQLALDFAADRQPVDASGFAGLEIEVCGPAERYGAHLRTTDLTRPWQSYRQSFETRPEWRTLRLPFSAFHAYRTEAPLALARLSRLGLIAIGREFTADLAVASVRFYR